MSQSTREELLRASRLCDQLQICDQLFFNYKFYEMYVIENAHERILWLYFQIQNFPLKCKLFWNSRAETRGEGFKRSKECYFLYIGS